MGTFGASISEARNTATGNPDYCLVKMEGFKHHVDEMISRVDKASIIISENYSAIRL